ncbi:MAG: helix-turn-helix transcriptional regulator, partial [Pseudomonadota bacterium]
MTSFGARFGVLIKTKRGEDRLTQQQVAEQAFEEGQGSKTAISDLERGKIAEPHQKTVDALVAFFDISAEELAACRETPVASVPELPSEFLEALGLSEALLFQLAAQFGHDNPRAGAAAYKAFLEQKAEEFRALEARLASLSEMEEEAAARERLDNQLKAARAAIADGAFEEADEILAAAEEVQQAEHTLREVRRQAALRTTRGEAALLNGDADTAHTHFAKAAAMFDPFDRAEAIEMRHKLEDRLYQHALRFGGRGFEGSAAILRSLLDTLDENAEAAEWARAQNSLAVALRNQGARTGGEAGAALLGEAVAAYRAALRVRTEEAHPVQWATTQNNLGVALRNQGERTGGEAGAALLGEAVAAYRAALRVCTEEAHPVHWAQTQNNLGTALSDQGARTGGEAGAALLAEAVSAYRVPRLRRPRPRFFSVVAQSTGCP